MRTITRTEITIETREVMVLNRRGSLIQSWCSRCRKQAGMVRFEEGALAGVNLQAARRKIEADEIHLVRLDDGSRFICLNSLLK